MGKKYQSEILMVCHQDAEALHRIGAITDEEMAEYDRDCLVNPPAEAEHKTPTEIIGALIREKIAGPST